MSQDNQTCPPPAIILAGGASSRMGSPKALLLWQENTFLESIHYSCRAAGISTIVIVTGFHNDAIRTAHPNLDADWIENTAPEHGMLSSIRCGLSLLSSKTNVLLCLVDHPAAQVETYRTLITAAQPDRIVIPVFSSRRGHPVIFGADFIPELQEGDCPKGARSVVHAHPDALYEVPVADPGILWDIDTPEEYTRYKST
jgi:molybdenum cofactor cytidylyltransferase